MANLRDRIGTVQNTPKGVKPKTDVREKSGSAKGKDSKKASK